MAAGNHRVQPASVADQPSRPAPDWYTLEEVAERLGRTRQAMHARVKAGTLRAERVGNRWLVSSEVVDALALGERAKAVSAGTVRVLHPQTGITDLEASLAEADRRIAQLELELVEARQAAGRRDGYIAELVRHVDRLREALAALTEAPGPPTA